MKKIVVILASLVVAVLIGVGNAFAHIPNPSLGPEWKLVFTAYDGTTFYINTRKITYLPEGIVKVWELGVPRGEFRRKLVNDLKNDLLSEGKDPNKAERLWYDNSLYKFNCKTHQLTQLEDIFYSFEKTVLDDQPQKYEEWVRISPGSPAEATEKYVCNETPPSIPAQYKQSIPNPPLGPEWKLVHIGSHGTTAYFNTRRITYLPGGIVKVRTLWVPRGEFRREEVNDLNNAERFWYEIYLDKINCKTQQFAILEDIFYSFGHTVLAHESFQHFEEWAYIPPGSTIGIAEKYVCNKPPIPDPSLSSEWKLLVRSSDGTTLYFNTRRITYLPKGIVKVWILWGIKGKTRREEVNVLKKHLLSEGEDPNNAERLGYQIFLNKFNCKTHQFAILEDIYYSFGQTVLYFDYLQHEEWDNIIPGTIIEKIENYVCK